jgi:hypothetical protein
VRQQLYDLGLPIGWAFDKSYTQDPRGVPRGGEGKLATAGWLLLKLFGLFMTGLAISQGAPFWFDLLNKFMVIRSTVKPYEKSAPEGSEDRRGAAPAALQPALAQPSAQGQPPLAQGEPPPLAGPALATVRLALDAGALTNIVLNKNGSPVPVDPDGFVELPLEVGEDHLLEATAIRNVDGAQVSWSRQVHAAMDDDGRPIEAELE